MRVCVIYFWLEFQMKHFKLEGRIGRNVVSITIKSIVRIF